MENININTILNRDKINEEIKDFLLNFNKTSNDITQKKRFR